MAQRDFLQPLSLFLRSFLLPSHPVRRHHLQTSRAKSDILGQERMGWMKEKRNEEEKKIGMTMMTEDALPLR